jgi:GR25 family glycosyltransferase involved in LPS biosynthesis/predicted Ser/Thr protein kinase
MIEFDEIKNHIATGVDAKILQYEENAVNISDDTIDIIDLLGGKQNCILINMEKDVQRYHTSVEQLKKVSIQNFVHLKGTDGRNKNKESLEKDLTYILNFISQFNPQVEPKQIKINEFSEINDPGVQIQDGPLGCYCSHLRALIYGYLNYEDYTIICEDDISITNTEKIKTYLPQIPNDWDIICLNSRAKNISYGDLPFYKFTDDFHSGHFYIVKNKCLPKLFSGMYPMTDQIDVLISDMVPVLNIYNIPDTVYQKNIKTNTQNNLSIIFSSPNYKPVTEALENSEEILNVLANKILPNNEERNKIIVKSLMHDVLYNFILLTDDEVNKTGENMETYEFDNIYKEDPDFILFVKYITFFLQCSRKGIDPKIAAEGLANVCLFTLDKFSELHNTSSGNIRAYGFGSTAHTYKIGDTILKRYNDKLRWSTDGHDNVNKIIQKEVDMLVKIQHINGTPKLISNANRNIYMSYCGESLYNDFNLPSDWKEQITTIFNDLTANGIWYPEFRLQNILVLDSKITFVDFGLCEFRTDCDNTENLNRFISYLGLMEQRFVNLDIDERQRLISTFSINKGL